MTPSSLIWVVSRFRRSNRFEGIAAAESANNAVTGATLIPLLTLGIPGDGMLLPDTPAMMVRPKTQTMKYSAVPSWAATRATWGRCLHWKTSCGSIWVCLSVRFSQPSPD